MSLDILTLREFVRSNLDDPPAGTVLIDVVEFPPHDGESDNDRAARFLEQKFGIIFSGEHLVDVSRRDASFLAARMLSRSPWYAHKPSVESERRAAELCRQFDDDVRVLSSTKFEINYVTGTVAATGRSILNGVMERGIIALDSRRVGIFWIGDEP